MPATNQWAVSTLIREVLADPDLAHDDVFRRLLRAGLQDLVDAEGPAGIATTLRDAPFLRAVVPLFTRSGSSGKGSGESPPPRRASAARKKVAGAYLSGARGLLRSRRMASLCHFRTRGARARG